MCDTVILKYAIITYNKGALFILEAHGDNQVQRPAGFDMRSEGFPAYR